MSPVSRSTTSFLASASVSRSDSGSKLKAAAPASVAPAQFRTVRGDRPHTSAPLASSQRSWSLNSIPPTLAPADPPDAVCDSTAAFNRIVRNWLEDAAAVRQREMPCDYLSDNHLS